MAISMWLRRAAQQIEQYMDNNVKVLQAVAAELRHTELRTWQQDRIVKNYVLDFREFRELTLFAPDRTVVASSRLSATSLRVPSDADRDTQTIAPIAVDDDFLPTTTITNTAVASGAGVMDGWWERSASKSSGVWSTVFGWELRDSLSWSPKTADCSLTAGRRRKPELLPARTSATTSSSLP